jgi:hypothetical protein
MLAASGKLQLAARLPVHLKKKHRGAIVKDVVIWYF